MGRAIVLELTGFSFQFYAILITSIQIFLFALYLSIGIFLFVSRSDDWLLLIVSLALITSIHADMYRALLNDDPTLTIPALLLGLINSILLIGLFYIFPTGTLFPRWSIILASLSGILLIAGAVTYNSILTPRGISTGINFFYTLVVFLPAMFVMLYRYKKVFTSIQRQQTRWVVFGIIVTWSGELILTFLRVLVPIFQQNALFFVLLNIVTLLWTTILPISILIAILRSHLWDIDLIIRRTLVYTSLTAILALFYFGSILVFQGIIQRLTGEQSPIVTITITLVIAALVTPLRQIIQNYIDRVFYRRRYNAELILEEFSLSLRSEVNLDQLTNQLISLIRNTMQPEFISLWLARDQKVKLLTTSEDEKPAEDLQTFEIAQSGIINEAPSSFD